jgi:hypothetical protein
VGCLWKRWVTRMRIATLLMLLFMSVINFHLMLLFREFCSIFSPVNELLILIIDSFCCIMNCTFRYYNAMVLVWSSYIFLSLP